ncbi:beta strand repeat-containing protein [Serratia entomophila]|nr:ABC-type protease/lipase transport system, ATPase and permease components [Serratia entomophila]CAI0799728.1 ABC-type protease/lipase transport system, ATPase and permease components [Serratia entomophila]CAI0800247.1 ABC-type protease/lipase transport system, ATPase and permease components [Serratia entomophila]CAI1593513.1 ABC-type protease/lipase transport system, ATPase and permease components [Serratia entomophila]CAI1636754.1 ABC-type protease/lipase transport system, ATPase and permea
MASLNYQKEAAALLLSVLGQSASATTYDSIGNSIEKGTLSAESYVDSLLSSAAGVSLYGGKSDLDVLSSIYTATYGSSAPAGYLTGLLASNSLETSITTIVNNLLTYSGFDAGTLSSQSHYDQQINAILYPSYSVAGGAAGVADATALYYLVGIDPVTSTVNTLGSQINAGSQTFAQVASKFISDRPALKALSNDALVNLVFNEGYGRAPTSAELSTYTSFLAGGGDKGQLLVNIITALRGTVAAGDTAAQQQFLHDTTPHAVGVIAGLAAQEQVASVFLAIPDRNVDAQGLDDWSSYLTKDGHTLNSLTAKLITSAEFQKKGAQLTGNDYIQHVYTDVHGVAANSTQLAKYAALGSDKALIATAIINDLRTSTATDAVTVTQQHAFEYDIGTSLTYKTAATLSASAANGNATGAVNTGASHVLSNAETAVLVNAVLNANAATTVNLKFADHLANLTINGSSASTVNLSDNGVNPGVDISVNNANVILNASSGSDDVTVTTAAAVNTGTGDFNLGAGNDTLKWAGNAAANGANTVGAGISGNGGAGTDVLSANFITKSVVTNQNALGVRSSTITSDASQFTSFEKVDLAGYIGKSVGTLVTTPLFGNPTTAAVTTANHTFDFGVLNGTATVEGTNGGSITQAATPSVVGTQGFVLSGLAEAVKVINVAGGTVAQLEVTGNATAASSLDFTFVQNATNKFDIAFTATSSSDVNAGSVSLNSSSSALFGTALSTVNIASGGSGNFENHLALTGTNTQVTAVNVTGDHQLDLTVGSGYSNVRTIDASGNTGGVDITANISGTGEGAIAQFIDLFPFGPIFTALFGLTGDNINITGTAANDTFSVRDNTSITGNGGNDLYKIVSSSSQSAVTVTDFNYLNDSVLDVKSNLLISNTTTGTQVADYGSKTGQALVDAIGLFTGTLFSGFVGAILGLNNNALNAKVGVSSVDNNHFLIVDENNDHLLDNNDTVVMLVGGTHTELVNNLHYA